MISNTFMMTDRDSDESYYDLLASKSTSEPANYKYIKLPIVLINRELSSNVFSDEENPKSLEVSSGLNITTYDYTRKLSNFCQLIQKKKNQCITKKQSNTPIFVLSLSVVKVGNYDT